MTLTVDELNKLETDLKEDKVDYLDILFQKNLLDEFKKTSLILFNQKTNLMKYCLIQDKKNIITYLLQKGFSLSQFYLNTEENPLVNAVINGNTEKLEFLLNLTCHENQHFSLQELHEALDYAFMFSRIKAIEILFSDIRILNEIMLSSITLGLIQVDDLIYLINKYPKVEFLNFIQFEIKINSTLFSKEDIEKIQSTLLVYEEKFYLNQIIYLTESKEVIKI